VRIGDTGTPRELSDTPALFLEEPWDIHHERTIHLRHGRSREVHSESCGKTGVEHRHPQTGEPGPVATDLERANELAEAPRQENE
jgi:hypothetical protein